MKTLKEIARAAGVSTTTVSNVINGNHRRVSAETVATVERLIRESGYIPNQFARSLAQRGSRIIAVVVQARRDENVFLNPYNAAYVGALTVSLYRHGYYPLLRFTDDFKTLEQDMRGWNVAGALFNGIYNHQLRQIESLGPIPTVFTDCYFDLPGVNHVGLDDATGGRLAGEYLAKMGHNRVGFIGTALDDSDVDQHRLAGFRQALAQHDLTLPDRWTIPDANWSDPRNPIRALLRDPEGPTAYLCCSDRIAVSLIQLARDLGLRVPDDISVVGFDDLPLASLSSPRLTTVGQNIDEKAELAVDTLVRHIEDKSLTPERMILGVRLVERESVGKRVDSEQV